MLPPAIFTSLVILMLFAASSRGQDLLESLFVTDASLGDEAAELDALGTLTGGGNLVDALKSEPNVSVSIAPGPVFSLRGVRQDGTPTLGTRSNPALGVLLGGVPRSTNTMVGFGAPAWDMGALEITHGPVLFGSGPVFQGGELRLEPNVPEFSHQGRLLVEAGEYGYFRSGLTENVVLIPDQLALRLNVASEASDGSVTNVVLDDDEFASVERHLLRGQLRWRPAGDESAVWDLTVNSEWTHGNSLGLAATLPGGDFFDREVALNTREEVPLDRHSISLRGKVELGDGRWIEGEVAWQTMDGYQFGDFDGSPFLDWFYKAAVDEQRLTGGTRFRGETERLAWTLGVYVESSEYTMDFGGLGVGPVPAGSSFASQVNEEVGMAAIFGRAEYEFSPRLWVLGGLRLDHQARDQRTESTFAGMRVGSNRVKVSSTGWLPELGMEWRGEEAKAGVKVARAYRPAAAASATTLGTSEPYGAERGWEANLYAEKSWSAIRAGGRLFYAQLNDQQVPYVAAGGAPILDEFILNAGKSTRAGAEVELEWMGPGDFSIGITGGYLFTEFDELVLNGVDRSGQEFPSSPEWSAAMHVGWNPAVGWFGESLLSWSDNSYSQADSPEATALEKRLLLSARAGYRWKHAELYVFGTNLLDEDFALVRRDYRSVGLSIDGAPNMPRLFGAGLAVHW
jgi:iron complex outermembrane recepter protein